MKVETHWCSLLESASLGLLHSWRGWFGDDQLRAVHIQIDLANAAISISLLTNREPYLGEAGLEGLGGEWPVGDWRLNDVNGTGGKSWPDAADALRWLSARYKSLSEQEASELDARVASCLEQCFSSDVALRALAGFRQIAVPLKLRVESAGGTGRIDRELSLPDLPGARAENARAAKALSAILLEALRSERSGNVAGAVSLLLDFLQQDPPADAAKIVRRELERLNSKGEHS